MLQQGLFMHNFMRQGPVVQVTADPYMSTSTCEATRLRLEIVSSQHVSSFLWDLNHFLPESALCR